MVALNLYLRLPFGKLHSRTPEIIQLSDLIDRTPGAVAMRLNNFAHVDPYHKKRGIRGLPGGKKQVEPIWNEYQMNPEKVLFESEALLAALEKTRIEDKYEEELKDINDFEGKTRLQVVKTRVNQSVFRKVILKNYNYKCAISGINHNNLLVASHIIPWSQSEKERLNPCNGLCLSPLYDKAFDSGLFTIDTNYCIKYSSSLKEALDRNSFFRFFKPFEGKKIQLPDDNHYYPEISFLEYHQENIYK